MTSISARGFRPFFLGASLHAVLVVPLWLAIWRGGLAAPGWSSPVWWHGHEMIFGTVVASIAGFLLTASPVWAGKPALVGRGLLGLFAVWVAGRVVMLAPDLLPPVLVAGVDLAFLPALALVLARTLRGRAQRRNHGIVALIGALALANALMHAEVLGLLEGVARPALRATVDGVIVLVLVIGGRITPAFTANALRRADLEVRIVSHPWLDRAAVGLAVATALANLAAPSSPLAGGVACAAGLAAAARLARWQSRDTGGDPLIWSLHAGMAWVAAGLILSGLSRLGIPALAAPGLHALTAGAMGGMIVAVMSRVSLGHTGRPLVVVRGGVLVYAFLHAGAVARVAAPLAPALYGPLLILATGLWAGAFGVFAALYGPMLLRPRVDGKSG